MDSSNNNTLQNNTMSGNKYNFDVSGNALSDYTQNIDTSNTVDGKPIYYWIDQQDEQIPDDAGFVGVVNSTNITVRRLILTNNGWGVLFAYTDNSRIENVNASNNGYGIYLWHSNNNTLQSNSASYNKYGGVVLSNSNNNTLQSNTVNSNNWCGIYLHSRSDNNTIYHNNFINNTWTNAYDISCGANQWDNGAEGNYWSDYTGTDSNGDGIGDTAYQIRTLCVDRYPLDRYPLMQPWTPAQKGDLNGDDQITTTDAVIALQIAASGGWNGDADVSGDGRVTSLDALMILQAAGGRIDL